MNFLKLFYKNLNEVKEDIEELLKKVYYQHYVHFLNRIKLLFF
jgi:hypothetical protein